ncbi:MAG TPA: hypothetical protein VM784_03790 [Actinomycetota bacterium]|nr:hypothetical protein [Actinomycetota bacterium]
MTHVRTAAAAIVAISLLAALISPASARQMRARDEPNVAGPLAPDPELHSCDSKKTRAKGKVVAAFTICLQWYRLAPESEADPLNDYGALWVRARANSKNGWCATRVKLETELPAEGTLAKAPRPGRKIEARRGDKETTSLLSVDAQGDAPDPGTIEQSYLVRPGTLRVTFDDETRTYRLKWNGLSRKAVAFATGIELSWPQGGKPWVPNEEEVPAIFGRFLEPGAC